MKQFYLAEITTKDKLVHQGIYFAPLKKSKKALLWVHGLTDNFYGDMGMLETLVDTLGKDGWGIASFNTRGHDIITNVKKLDPQNPKGHTGLVIGSAYENFIECVYDIDAGIRFLINQGFTEIVIAGVSTGANKVCYYAGTQKNPRVAGVLLVSPLSDVPIEKKGKNYRANLKRVKQLLAQGKEDMLIEGYAELPLTPKRYLSLYEPGGVEDVFDYYAKQPKLKVFSNIKKPLCIILAGSDEYTDRPVADILAVYKKYQRSTNFHSAIIPSAFHSFGEKEKETIQAILDWLKSI